MISTPSQRHHKIDWKLWVIILAALFSLAVIGFWIYFVKDKNQMIAFLGAGYALLCTGFLVAQIVAFVKAHIDYDKTIEDPKYDMILMEENEWKGFLKK